MRLHIENFAKISTADIQFDGLTVIAGDNNTGKSTVGKVLYSIFRGTSDIVRRVREERVKTVRTALSSAVHSPVSDEDCQRVMEDTSTLQDFLVGKFMEELRQDGRSDMPEAQLAKISSDFAEGLLPRVRPSVENATTLSDDRVKWVILRRVFECVFHRQYHPLKADMPPAVLKLDVKGRTNSMKFLHDHAELSSGIDLFAHALLLSDPDVLSYVNVKDMTSSPLAARLLDKNVYELVGKLSTAVDGSGGIQEEGRREFLSVALRQLDSMIRGSLGVDEQGDLALREDGNDRPTKVENLSMGMKSLLLLRTLLVKGVLSERDVLILDEPENHLHPEWQVYYAQALVLIQKAYDLTLLVTTHSQFFVNALQRFSISENIVDKTNFYVSRKDDSRPGYCTFDSKGRMAGPILQSFNRAFGRISEISGEFSGGHVL